MSASLDRLLAAAEGNAADRKPVIVLQPHPRSDAAIVEPGEEWEGDVVALVEVLNPYGRAAAFGVDINGLVRDNPSAGARELSKLCDEVRAQIDAAAQAGADGICYRLVGAEPSHTTPMQYGGLFLERDRELLEYAAGATLNMTWVDAGEGAYLDFVSDLPAQLFAWDIDRTNVSVVEMRALRPTGLAAEDPTADVLFAPSFDRIASWIDKENANATA